MKHKSFLAISFFVLNCITSFAQTLQLPYKDVGACPFECCTYRQWIANEDTIIYKEMRDGSPMAFKVKSREKVMGVTGVVITTKAGQVKALRNAKLERISVKAGDVLYTLTYLGEGYYKVWYKGKFTTESFIQEPSLKVLSEPQGVWWVKIRNRKGQIGWTRLSENFDNQDACGGTPDAQSNSPAVDDSGEGIVPAPQAKTSTSIRQVDFRNFTYTNVLHPSTEEKIDVEVRNGQFIYGNQISSSDWDFVIKEIVYGDVTNDGKEDAIVNAVMTTYGSSNPASVDKSNLFLYTLENGKPILISNELGVLESYNPTVGDDCDSWIDVVSIKSILNEKMRVEAIVSSPSCFGKGYSGYKLAMSYRWSGSKFVLVGKPIKIKVK